MMRDDPWFPFLESVMSRSKKSPWSVGSAAGFGSILALLLLPALGTAQQSGNPNLWAGIEIGGTGVKLVILDSEANLMDAADRPGNITVNVKKGKDGNEFAADAIERTVEAVRQLRDLAKEKQVPDHQTFVVASSGVADLKAKNWDTLATEVSKLFNGKRLDAIDVGHETGYTFLAVVPKEDYGNAIYIDIGGSNTKFGYVTSDGSPYVGFVSFGSSSLLKGIPAEADVVKEVDRRLGRVTEELKKAKAKLADRPNVYLGGGASWVMAMLEGIWDANSPKPLRPGKPVEISADRADKTEKIVSLKKRVRDRQRDPYQPDKEPTPAQKKELENIKNFFASPSRLVAAAAMLEAVAEAFDFKNAGMKVNHLYFTPNSHLAWIYGYVKAKIQEKRNPEKPLTREEFRRELDEIKKELGDLRNNRPARNQDAQLKVISEAISTLSEHMKSLANRPPVPPPPAIDLKPLVEEIQKLRQELPKATTPPPQGSRLPPPAPSANRDAAAQHFARGVESYLGWRFEQALIHFDAASRADAQDPSHWYGLILTQHRLGLTEFAKVSAQRVATAYRNNPQMGASVAIAFERIQGSERTTADGYIQNALNDLILERRTPAHFSSAGMELPGDRSARSGITRR
jgi:exopolyphosphatase/pppGpp-phosphohydrolase